MVELERTVELSERGEDIGEELQGGNNDEFFSLRQQARKKKQVFFRETSA